MSSAARSTSSSVMSRCVTARMTVGWIVAREANPCLAQDLQRLRPVELERLEVDLDEVRLHLAQVDRRARGDERVRKPSRPDVIVGEPVDVVVERVDAGRRHDSRLPHRPAEQVLLAPGPLDELPRAGE